MALLTEATDIDWDKVKCLTFPEKAGDLTSMVINEGYTRLVQHFQDNRVDEYIMLNNGFVLCEADDDLKSCDINDTSWSSPEFEEVNLKMVGLVTLLEMVFPDGYDEKRDCWLKRGNHFDDMADELMTLKSDWVSNLRSRTVRSCEPKYKPRANLFACGSNTNAKDKSVLKEGSPLKFTVNYNVPPGGSINDSNRIEVFLDGYSDHAVIGCDKSIHYTPYNTCIETFVVTVGLKQ